MGCRGSIHCVCVSFFFQKSVHVATKSRTARGSFANSRSDPSFPISYMDSRLVTSERGPYRRGTVVMSTAPIPSQSLGPSVTCRQCRIQIPLDEMESHECDPKDVKVATHSPRASTTVLQEAASRASSFLDSFLDTSASSQKTSEETSLGYETSKDKPFIRGVEPVHSAFSVTTSAKPYAVDDTPLISHRYESLPQLHSPTSQSAHSESSGPDLPSSPPNHLARLGRSSSVASYTPTTIPATAPSSSQPRRYSNSETSTVPIQCRVRGVRLNKEKIALYSIVSNIFNQHDNRPAVHGTAIATPREVIVERRYREFYAFAVTVYAMFPSKDLWSRLPPKTLCLPTSRNQSGGFLLRRKNGLDDFIRKTLELIDLGSSAQGSIGQWYLVRKFLNLPPNVASATQPTKDRNLVAAMQELTKHARQMIGWVTVGRADEHDTTYEKISDGFHMVKRVKTCPFPARAVFDLITKRDCGNFAKSVTPNQRNGEDDESASSQPEKNAFINPLVESVEVLHRENRQTWTERVVLKGGWGRRNMEMLNLKTWRVDDSGSIIIVMIPAEDSDWITPVSEPQRNTRVDCILGGWIISPISGEDTCSVTWIMQANFGECDPRNEFTGSQGFSTTFVARSCLLAWADELTHLVTSLETTYDPVYYRNLGPLLSGDSFHKLKLERRDTTSGSPLEDPRVYILAHDLEPSMCLLIHKSTNTNALVFRTNHRRTSDKQKHLDLDVTTPLKAEWIMFEKAGNPRQDLSVIEKSTTYPFSTRNIGPNVFHFSLELLRRDCVLRYDPVNGYGLFTTINGKPNILLKRVYLSYSKPTSRIAFSSKLEEIQLFGKSEVEIISA